MSVNINYPAVSVILSVYNDESNITDALNSLKNLNNNSIEFIIINDGSTDQTLQLLKNYEKLDKRFKIYDQPNIGLTKSLNKGILLSKGKYIARLDSDDILLPNRINQQLEFLEKNQNISLVCGLTININNNNKIYLTDFLKEDQLKIRLQKVNCIPHSSVMIRSSALKEIGHYNEQFTTSQDYELWMRFLSSKHRIVMLPEVLVIRKITLKGVSRTKLLFQSKNSFLIRKRFSNINFVHNLLLFLHQFIFGFISNIIAKVDLRK